MSTGNRGPDAVGEPLRFQIDNDSPGVFFGGNDWDAGARGEEFGATSKDAVDRSRRATHGKADVLVLTANPSAARCDGLAELAEACPVVARDRNAGIADTEKAFHTAGPGMRSSPRRC
ncbi:MAG TPA: hypothetical protein VGG65_10720 [Thermoanaerobaculia bacterium]